ncbi:hypothetical protein EGH21_07620 [Halomicroarcula sp. F13]|uniref:Uncharacterized protein n=1 Tax=Haloarcula rubra TaxID=2487747 RepID=A0AAW4PMU3_9EURY|nr:hypothetical protein [Halomicroarcula rubra]MBX0322898.1 hypothetical protein [Halomicroarcula rubra]
MAIGEDLLVPTLIVGGIGLFLLGAGLREAYLTVRLWRRRAVPIGDLGEASGTVTVTGRAERIDETRRAPLSGRDCLAYAWRIVGLRTVRGFDGASNSPTTNSPAGRTPCGSDSATTAGASSTRARRRSA